MRGYVGDRARRRKRRIFFIIFFVIIFLTIIYFSYNVKNEKKEINNEITFTDATIDTEQSRIDREELELKIIEKEQNIIFRDQASGQIKEIPVSAVAKQKNTSSFSAIKHRDLKRVVTVYSGLAPGYTDAGAVVGKIQKEMNNFEVSEDIHIDYTGQLEEQQKQMNFLMGAFFSGLGLIMLILIFQFSSISKPTIIMLAIFLSFIGVFGGLMITGWSFVIMMTMMGIISLAGIVVNNGVVLLDYAQILIDRRKIKLGLNENEDILLDLYSTLEDYYSMIANVSDYRDNMDSIDVMINESEPVLDFGGIWKYAAYSQMKINLTRFTVTTGLRFDWVPYNSTSLVSPRVGASFSITPSGPPSPPNKTESEFGNSLGTS